MVAIQIRDVPESTRDALVEAARLQGKSLQAYLFDVLKREADAAERRRLLREWAENPLAINDRNFDTAAIIRAQREERERELARRVIGE
jgi:antitoxin FitA